MAMLFKRIATSFNRSLTLRSISNKTDAIKQPFQYVNGKRVTPASKEEFGIFYPATYENFASTHSARSADVDGAVLCALNAQKVWGAVTAFERGKLLRKAADLVRANGETLAQLETLDTGKPIWESRADIMGCADTLDYYGGVAPTLTGKHTPLGGGSFAYTRPEPLGVCGGIGAWNYPFQMSVFKSAPALACGNTMVFKPSPLTPITAVMLAEIYTEAGLPLGAFNVIQGDGETGSLLSEHPGISKMSFTGSVPTGAKVMAACAPGIKPVTLELGGKSPLIIFDDCDVENAAKGAMLANFLNQGQVCSNGTRVFVQKNILPKFLEKVKERTQRMVIGDPEKENTTVGAMINADQATKVLGFIDRAKNEGCQVACGGTRTLLDAPFQNGHFLEPCVLTDVRDEMEVAREEVFGSVMAVLGFDSEEEVIARANSTEFGLAAGVFTQNLARGHRVVAQLEAGAVYINNYNYYPPEIPFGGFKKSGIGCENGIETMKHYTQVKSVYVELNDVDSGPL